MSKKGWIFAWCGWNLSTDLWGVRELCVSIAVHPWDWTDQGYSAWVIARWHRTGKTGEDRGSEPCSQNWYVPNHGLEMCEFLRICFLDEHDWSLSVYLLFDLFLQYWPHRRRTTLYSPWLDQFSLDLLFSRNESLFLFFFFLFECWLGGRFCRNFISKDSLNLDELKWNKIPGRHSSRSTCDWSCTKKSVGQGSNPVSVDRWLAVVTSEHHPQLAEIRYYIQGIMSCKVEWDACFSEGRRNHRLSDAPVRACVVTVPSQSLRQKPYFLFRQVLRKDPKARYIQRLGSSQIFILGSLWAWCLDHQYKDE